MIKRFDEYINEGVRDKMTPKSDEDIRRLLDGLNPYVKIRKAIEYGVFSVVKEIIEEGIDLKKNLGGGTPAGRYFVTEAIEYGKLDILKYLLDNGCSLDKLEKNYNLGKAIERGHYDVAKFLVDELGASVSDEEGDLYLEMAVDSNNLEMVKLVLDMECEYFERDWLKGTLLGMDTDTEIIEYLIEKVPDIKSYVKELYDEYKLGSEILEKYV